MARRVSPVLGGLLGASGGISAMLRGQIAGIQARQQAKQQEAENQLRRDQLGFEFQRLRQQRELTLKELKQRADKLQQERDIATEDQALRSRQLDIMEQGNFLDYYASLARTRASASSKTEKAGLGEITDADFQKHFTGMVDDQKETLMSDTRFAFPGIGGIDPKWKPGAQHYGTMLDVLKEPESIAAETLGHRQKREIVRDYGKFFPGVNELLRTWDDTGSPGQVLTRLQAVSEDLSTMYGEAATNPETRPTVERLHNALIERYSGLHSEDQRRVQRYIDLGIPGFEQIGPAPSVGGALDVGTERPGLPLPPTGGTVRPPGAGGGNR